MIPRACLLSALLVACQPGRPEPAVIGGAGSSVPSHSSDSPDSSLPSEPESEPESGLERPGEGAPSASAEEGPGSLPSCVVREHLSVGEAVVAVLADDSLVFTAGLAIDADGAPRAYHPDDTGLDALANAGSPGNWWALALDAGGEPLVQGLEDPAPGYYVSMTALEDRRFGEADPRRYVDAEHLPYVVLPPEVRRHTQAALGDLALVFDPESGRHSVAIFADIGPRRHLGEGSIALAKALGLAHDARRGGTRRPLKWVVWSQSGDGKAHDGAWIAEHGQAALDRWGGLSRLRACLP